MSELPVVLEEGVLRVGSSLALAGVPSMWQAHEATPEARRASSECAFRGPL